MTIHATKLRFWGLKVLETHPLAWNAEVRVSHSRDGIIQRLGYRRMVIRLFDEVLCVGDTCGGKLYQGKELNTANLELKDNSWKSTLLGESTRYTAGPYRKEGR